MGFGHTTSSSSSLHRTAPVRTHAAQPEMTRAETANNTAIGAVLDAHMLRYRVEPVRTRRMTAGLSPFEYGPVPKKEIHGNHRGQAVV